MDHHLSISSNSTLAGHPPSPPGGAAREQVPKSTPRRELKGVYCSVGKKRRIVFRYRCGRWDQFESLYPWCIREALRIGLERIDEAVPSSLDKAAKLDDENWLANNRRTRRYIAESPELLYIDSPHLQGQSEKVSGYHVTTNIPWRDVPNILRLICQAADLEYGSLADIPL
jgi:hypothetical protein